MHLFELKIILKGTFNCLKSFQVCVPSCYNEKIDQRDAKDNKDTFKPISQKEKDKVAKNRKIQTYQQKYINIT